MKSIKGLGQTMRTLRACAIIFLASIIFSCGSHRSANTPAKLQAQPQAQTLGDALAQLDALPVPDGVKPEVFLQLKAALREALTCRAVTCAPPSGDSGKADHGGPRVAALQRIVSTPPTGDANRVKDLAIADNGDGTYSLTWHYRNLGDYNQDGTVGVSDITPLAVHYGETWTAGEENSIAAVVDGSGNGTVDISDVTPIAINFGVDCLEYRVQGQVAQGAWAEIDGVSFSLAQTGDGRHHFSYDLGALNYDFYRVVPCDNSVVQGVRSVVVPESVSQPPNIVGLNPYYGISGESVTFSANVEGSSPFSNIWDFGGGATPNSSGEASPTVTLTTPGTYDAALTVTNAFGEDAFRFTLTVTQPTYSVSGHVEKDTGGGLQGVTFTLTPGNLSTTTNPSGDYTIVGVSNGSYTLTPSKSNWSFEPLARNIIVNNEDVVGWNFITWEGGENIWTHTWGGASQDVAYSLCMDSIGNMYATGSTRSFGAGHNDAFLLKYSSTGALLWEKTWGGSNDDCASSICGDSTDYIYIAGSTRSFGAISQDAFLLKYSSEGSLIWQKTWGGSEYEAASALCVDSDDNVYIAGGAIHGLDEPDALLLKYSPNGSLLWSKTWGSGGFDHANALCTDNGGNVYVAGYTDSFGLVSGDTFILKYSPMGELLWQKTWGGYGVDETRALCVDGNGNVYAVGDTPSFGVGRYDAFLLKYSSTGSILQQSTWGGAEYEMVHAISLDSNGDAYLAGVTNSFSSDESNDAFILKCSPSDVFLMQKLWHGNDESSATAIFIVSDGLVLIAGAAMNAYGSWRNVNGSTSSPIGIVTTPSGTETIPSGTEGTPNGTETSPISVKDEGGGDIDALVMNIDPSSL